MSTELSKVRVFTDKMFKNATPIERMYIHMMEPERFVLNNTDHVRLEEIKDCFSLVNDKISAAEQIQLILENIRSIETWESANKLLREMETLFGDVVTRNREYTRTLYINKLRSLAAKAEEDGDIAEARRCIQSAAKLDHMDIPEQQQIDPNQFKVPEVTFTTDISVLDAEVIETEEK